MIELADQILAHRLGLGFLHDLSQEVCHHYENACRCSECVEREDRPARVNPIQFPWEQAA